MAGVRRHERFVEDERGFLEAGLEVAVRPGRIGVLAHRQTAGLVLLDFCLGPFQVLTLREAAAADPARASAAPRRSLPRADSSHPAAATRPDRR